MKNDKYVEKTKLKSFQLVLKKARLAKARSIPFNCVNPNELELVGAKYVNPLIVTPQVYIVSQPSWYW